MDDYIRVKEVSNPAEGEYTLDTAGNLVVFRNGQWEIVERNYNETK